MKNTKLFGFLNTFLFFVLLPICYATATDQTDYSFLLGEDSKLYRWDNKQRCAVIEETGKCYRDVKAWSGYDYLTGYSKEIRIRIIGATTNNQGKLQIPRPFLIVDGINLSPEAKSLQDFEDEIVNLNKEDKAAGRNAISGDILGGLQTAGYTPILVQFNYTTRNSLARNSAIFSHLLEYLGSLPSKAPIVWPGASSQGFNILGISQGGVLSRYGSYLYDSKRFSNQPPVFLYASLDSPHQGAVVPRGLLATIDFWGRVRSQAAAKTFLDVITAPGAGELLIYDTEQQRVVESPFIGKQVYKDFPVNRTSSRWLFGTYRNAANYNGFREVLISNGQLDGENNSPSATSIYKLNRWSEKGGATWGRAVSHVSFSDLSNTVIAYNREYKYNDYDVSRELKGKSEFDLVQGSTFPFYSMIYDAFESAFFKAIPNHSTHYKMTFYGKWDEHQKNLDNGTFIPTTSSLDLLCNGDLSVRSSCVQTQTSSGINWENPGSRSTANSIYAVDPTHPNSTAENSGKHVTGATTTVDLWRLFCEVAKADWDSYKGEFQNPNLTGNFDPNAVCMSQNAMSPWFTEIVAPKGYEQTTQFPWARWVYNSKKVDKQFPVSFTLPAGWNSVATFDRGQSLGSCDVINVTLKAKPGFKSNWLYAELILSKTKGGSGWWQFGEQDVAVDGNEHKVFWQLPCNRQALNGYRWATLVLNSQGGGIEVKDVHISNSEMDSEPPQVLANPWIVPVNQGVWNFGTWGAHDPEYSDALGTGIKLTMPRKDDGAYFDAGNYRDLGHFRNLKVVYWPGTCQNTWLYFDRKVNKANLAGGVKDGSMLSKTIPLSSIIDRQITPQKTLSGQRLYAQTAVASETCIIKEIKLQ